MRQDDVYIYQQTDIKEINRELYNTLSFGGKIKYNYNQFMNKYFPKKPKKSDSIKSMDATAKSLEWALKDEEID